MKRKNLITLILLVLISSSLLAQPCDNAKYNRFIAEGDAYYKKANYTEALNSYNAAMIACKDRMLNVQKRTQAVFAKINQLRDDAQKSEKQALIALKNMTELLRSFLPDSARNMYKYFKTLADNAYKAGNYTDAIKYYTFTKNTPEVENAQAIENQLTKATELNKLQKEADNYFRNTFDYEKAKPLYQKILQQNPDDRTTHLKLICYEPDMVQVEGGTFEMGSNEDKDEKPIHKVTLSSFSISRFECTVAQFAYFLNHYGSDKVKTGDYKGSPMIYEYDWGVKQKDGKWTFDKNYENHPIVYVTWFGANEYCNWLSETTGKKYRLPTEAEWEYAARGGNKSKGYQYSGSDSLSLVGWYENNIGSTQETRNVGLKLPNELGIYDMSGNVWEWCADWYSSTYYSENHVNNPINFKESGYRLLRGGSWSDDASSCRVAFRGINDPSNNRNYCGFRFGRAGDQ